jgi:hypothetical protein
MAMRIEHLLKPVPARGSSVLDLVPELDRGTAETAQERTSRRSEQPPAELAQITARRIAVAARRQEAVVRRESLWSQLLELDEWRKDLAARCRASCAQFQALSEPRPPSSATASEQVPRRAHEHAGQLR